MTKTSPLLGIPALHSGIPHLWISLCVGFILTFVSSNSAQVTFIFNQTTKQISFGTNPKWKPGEMLTLELRSCPAKGFKYELKYSASEYFNSKGFDVFTGKALTLAPLDTCNVPYLPVIIENKDYAQITVEEYYKGVLVSSRTYSHNVTGGLKFDVSTGVFVTGLRDETYVLQKESDLTNKIIKEKNGDFRVGTGVLAHLHSRCKGVLNVGLCGGFELNNDAKVGYLFGGSLLFGRDKKFCFNVGVVVSKKEVISNAYKDLVDKSVSDILTEVPMVSLWDDGFFGAVTYNF